MSRKVIVYYRTPKTGSCSIYKTIDACEYKTMRVTCANIPKLLKTEGLEIITINPCTYPDHRTKHGAFGRIQIALEEKRVKEDLEYESFGVVREPYDKFISSINYSLRSASNWKNYNTVDAIVDAFIDGEIVWNPLTKLWQHIIRTQTRALTYATNFVVKHFIRFENLSENVQDFFKQHGYDIDLMHVNKTGEKPVKMNEKYFDYVNKQFREDFENFNYPMRGILS